MARRGISAFVSVLSLLVAAPAASTAQDDPAGDPRYGSPITLPFQPSALNDADPVQVVGDATVWRSGQVTTIQGPAGSSSIRAIDINDAGDVVGHLEGACPDPSGTPDHQGFLWSDGELEVLGGPSNECSTTGNWLPLNWDINNRGMVAGSITVETYPSGENHPHPEAHVWDGAAPYSTLHRPGWIESVAHDINDEGQITGIVGQFGEGTCGCDKAVRWSLDGDMVELGSLATDSGGRPLATVPAGLNSAGDVVGFANAGPLPRAFLWRNGTMTGLPFLGQPFDDWSWALGVNDSGQVVGVSGIDPGGSANFRTRAVLWERTGSGAMRAVDLNTLVPQGTGWVLEWAYDINERGEIVGAGTGPDNATFFLLKLAASELLDLLLSNARAVAEPGGGANGAATVSNRSAGDRVYSVFTVRRSGTGTTSTVRFATRDGTAKAGADYRARSGSLTFGPDDTTKKVKVLILPDGKAEPTEKFSLVLSRPTEAEIGDGKGVATINDND